jgi:hypothetical protein
MRSGAARRTRGHHRRNGPIVKPRDDLLDATWCDVTAGSRDRESGGAEPFAPFRRAHA